MPTDQQIGELDRRLTRLEPLVRARAGGGGTTYPPGGDPGDMLTFVGPDDNDVTWTEPSGAGDKNYVHAQGAPSATWIVNHGLGKFPSVEVVDSGGSAVIPSVLFNDVNTLTLAFGSPTSGKAFVN